MPFGSRTVAERDVNFNVNLGQFRTDISQVGVVYARTTGQMSDEALRLSVAQERLNKTIARSGPESTAAKSATLAYRREVASLASESKVAAAAEEARGRVTRTVAQQARESIVQETSQRAALASLAIEYRKVAAAAVAGSEEQVAAAKLAEKAVRDLGIQTAASASTAGRGTARGAAGVGLRGEERELSALGRGALAGSGVFRGLGRAVAFSSTAFLGGTGLVYAIRAASKAAVDHQKVEANLANALSSARLDYQRYREEIDKTLLSQRQLSGFTEEETVQAFSKLVRTTGDVNKALRYTAVAANLARGANTSLDTAAGAINKALVGQATALRRTYAVEIPKGISGYQAIQRAAEKYAGASAAFADTAAGKQARLTQAIHQTEITIGTALLPTITRLSGNLATYLEKAGTQEKIQRDVNKAVKVGGEVAHDLGRAYDDLAPIVKTTTHLLGGTKNALEVLFAVYAGNKLRRALIEMGLLQAATARVGTAAVVSEAETATAMTGIGASATTASAKVGAVRGSLIGLSALQIAPIVIPIAIEVQRKIKGEIGGAFGGTAASIYSDVTGFLTGGVAGNDPVSNFVASLFGGGKKKPKAAEPAVAKPSPDRGFRDANLGVSTKPPPAPLDRLTKINLELAAAQTAAARGDKGAQQRIVAALKEQIDYDRQYEKAQEDLIRRGIGDRKQHAQILQRLEGDEQSALGQIKSIEQDAARKRADAQRKREAQQRKEAAARRKRFAALTTVPAALVAREAHAESSHAATTRILGLLNDEKRAVEKQEAELRKQGAPETYLARAAKTVEAIQKHIDQIRKQARAKRISSLTRVPVDLQLQLETAIANNASEDRLLALYRKERAALEKQVAELRKIGASKQDILKARTAEAAVQKHINEITKKAKVNAGAEQAQFLSSFQQIVGTYAPNVFPQKGKTESHLYDMVHETRRQTKAILKLVGRTTFPASGYAISSAAAVTG